MSARADALADRILKGARALAKYANGLTDKQWATPTSDGRPVGVVVHHVASVYPLEVDLAQVLAAGKPIKATWADVNAMNANHAKDNASVTERIEAVRCMAAIFRRYPLMIRRTART